MGDKASADMAAGIRRFARQDQDQARGLILLGLGEHFGFIDESANPDIDDIEKTFLEAGNSFFVAEREHRIVGTAGLLLEAPPDARIVRMSVDSSLRRSGIASSLLEACRQAARRQGRLNLLVFTEPHWENAVRFYLANGFVQYGKDAVDIRLRMAL